MWPFTNNTQQGPRYRTIDQDYAVAGQISEADIAKLKEAGFKSIICARPDNEDPGQPSFATISAAAERAGMKAAHIPVSGMVGEGQLIRMEKALKDLPTPIFAYCRSGGRAGSLYGAAKAAGGR
jgi:uncharacterized protein (TIGR01244 family)